MILMKETLINRWFMLRSGLRLDMLYCLDFPIR